MTKPALTEEEWEEHKAGSWGKWNMAYPAGDNGLVLDGQWERHELAARCLNEQPYGFTREMAEVVSDLTGHEGVTDGRGNVYLCTWVPAEKYALLEVIAANILALLPPEAKP